MRLMTKMRSRSWIFFWAAIFSIYTFCPHKAMAESHSKIGVLIVGHGYFSENPKFFSLADEVQSRLPDYHVASALHMVMDMTTFLMWQTEDEAIRKLEAEGVEKVIVVPLYLSTNSSTVQVIKWTIGCKVEGEPDKSDYLGEIVDCPGEYDSQNDLCKHMGAIHRRFQRFSNMCFVATDALDYHSDVSTVLLERAQEFSTDPANEVVLLVSHGYGDDTVDQDYRDNVLAKYASDVKNGGSFFDVQYGTVREDWCDKRVAAVQELRDKITTAVNDGHKVIWVPVRIASWSNIHEQEWDPPDCTKLGIKDLLDAGKYIRANYMLYKPESLADWVVSMVNEAVDNNQYTHCHEH
ncbi:MAG: sirohydrochlorin chelatase [Candidatus Brocadia sp.]